MELPATNVRIKGASPRWLGASTWPSDPVVAACQLDVLLDPGEGGSGEFQLGLGVAVAVGGDGDGEGGCSFGNEDAARKSVVDGDGFVAEIVDAFDACAGSGWGRLDFAFLSGVLNADGHNSWVGRTVCWQVDAALADGIGGVGIGLQLRAGNLLGLVDGEQ